MSQRWRAGQRTARRPPPRPPALHPSATPEVQQRFQPARALQHTLCCAADAAAQDVQRVRHHHGRPGHHVRRCGIGAGSRQGRGTVGSGHTSCGPGTAAAAWQLQAACLKLHPLVKPDRQHNPATRRAPCHPHTWPRLQQDRVSRPAGSHRLRQAAKLAAVPVRRVVHRYAAATAGSGCGGGSRGKGQARRRACGRRLLRALGTACGRAGQAAGGAGRVRHVQPAAPIQGQVAEALQGGCQAEDADGSSAASQAAAAAAAAALAAHCGA